MTLPDWNTDMSAAPRDGSEVLGMYRGCRIVMRWHPVERWWVADAPPNYADFRGYQLLGSPTAWMPLPEPMKEAPDGE